LIYPLSVFGITWVSITAVLLAYTALVTPPVIAFHWLDPDCTVIPTYVCERRLRKRGREGERERERGRERVRKSAYVYSLFGPLEDKKKRIIHV